MSIKVSKSAVYALGNSIKVKSLGLGGILKAFLQPSQEQVEINHGATGFWLAKTHKPFRSWGYNYFRRPSTSDSTELVLEEFWNDAAQIREDLSEAKVLGANVIRIHLQFGKFFPNSDLVVDSTQITYLKQFVSIAEELGLYLQITGLGCYYTSVNPAWYMALNESDRLTAQELFWTTISAALTGRTSIFAYDLINEPLIPGAAETRTSWLTTDNLGGNYYPQYLALSRNGRTAKQISKAFFDRMTAAIRQNDVKTLITAGIIPNTKAQFYGSGTDASLDFADFHYYPTAADMEAQISELNSLSSTYGKPVTVGETSTLYVNSTQLKYFLDNTSSSTSGYISHYWGWTPQEYVGVPGFIPAIMRDLLNSWSSWTSQFRSP
jgi:hypothetical protein